MEHEEVSERVEWTRDDGPLLRDGGRSVRLLLERGEREHPGERQRRRQREGVGRGGTASDEPVAAGYRLFHSHRHVYVV